MSQRLNFSLATKQGLKQSLSPQILNTINILRLSQDELYELLKEQAENNPFIVISDKNPESNKYINNFSTGNDGFDKTAFLENLPQGHNLVDHLRSQIAIKDHDVILNECLEIILAELNSNGYLNSPLFELAEAYKKPLPKLEHALAVIQGCDPTGVGARNLSECLMLQLKERGIFDQTYEYILEALPLLNQWSIAEISNYLKIEPEILKNRLSNLKKLNPRPGAKFDNLPQHIIQPDIIVKKLENNQIAVELNDIVYPKTEIFEKPTALKLKKDSEISILYKNALKIRDALLQRERAIERIANVIISEQELFFQKGGNKLKPLTMAQVSKATGLHESTVSRVVHNKYLQCKFGIFELKSFFSSAIKSKDDNEIFSSHFVKHRIKELVSEESQSAPLSDEDIKKNLAKEGIIIARRTIAKYRNHMGIESFSKRAIES